MNAMTYVAKGRNISDSGAIRLMLLGGLEQRNLCVFDFPDLPPLAVCHFYQWPQLFGAAKLI